MEPDAPVAVEPILDTLAMADRAPSSAALRQVADRWSEIGPELLEKLDAVIDGTDRSERTETILSFGIYLMAQAHETRAYRPLCRLAADGDVLSDLIGDGVTEDLRMILTRIYDGDPAPLKALIEDAGADEFNRDVALDALAQLTAAGRIGRDETQAYLRELRTTLQPQDTSYVWMGWQRAIANLGLDDLVPLVEDVFERGWIEPVWLDVADFHADLQATLRADEPNAAVDEHTLDGGPG